MRRVLVLQPGSTDPRVKAHYGDYGDWFARLLAPRVALRVVRADAGRLPPFAPFDGLIMTGSPCSVTEPEPWMEECASYTLGAARTHPVLGVCFGHQLLARALGGEVERNPLGREAGTSEVTLTAAGAADPLFAGLAPRPAFQQTHEDHVSVLPAGATLLAENAFSPVQAYAVGDAIRCVQFHPEMDAGMSRLLAEARRERLDRQAPGGSVAVLASIRVTPAGKRVLTNWVTRFVGAP